MQLNLLMNNIPSNASDARETQNDSSTENSNTDINKINKGRKFKRVMSAIGGGVKTIGSGVRYVAPKAARMAAVGTLSLAGATAGLAAGLVSDDYSNVVKWTAAGLGTGLVAGRGLVPRRLDGTANMIKETRERSYAQTHTRSEVQARQNAQLDKAFLKDKERVKLYSDELNVSQKRAREIMEKEAMQYRKEGVTDDDIIIKSMKADRSKFGSDTASKERILLAKMAQEVNGDKKGLESIEKGLAKRGIGQEDISKYSNAIRDIYKWT